MLPYRFSDVPALCGKPIYGDSGSSRLLVNPTLIVEVLPFRLKTMTEKKSSGYVYQSKVCVCFGFASKKFVALYAKYTEKLWFQSEYAAGETLKLESLDCDLNIDQIYQGIVFEL